MIAEGLRMKIALVLLVLMGLVLLGLPFAIEGDSSLSGAVRSFMSYSLTATAVLLSFLTIFMSRSLSDELVNRQILITMTKPIPRWQFLLGKWLGITMLNAGLLVFAGGATYGMVHYIAATRPPLDERYDQAELRDQVMVARHAIQCTLPDFARTAEREYERNLELGKYAGRTDFDPKREKHRLTKKHEYAWRVVGVLQAREFTFRNVLCDRSAGKTVQIRYKARVSQAPVDEVFRSVWLFGDPTKNTNTLQYHTKHVVDRFHDISVPADCVADDHTLRVVFYNRNPFPGELQAPNIIEFGMSEGVEILFVVGSFEWNLLRLLCLMMCKLMFLAAVGLLMTSVFSFPVACLASFTVYALAGMRSFIFESLDWVEAGYHPMFSSINDFLGHVVYYVYRAISWVIPDFSYYDAVETFVSGRNVSLVWVLNGIGELVLFQTTFVLGIAMLLFHRREVSEVSV
jgi:hypothetical protein